MRKWLGWAFLGGLAAFSTAAGCGGGGSDTTPFGDDDAAPAQDANTGGQDATSYDTDSGHVDATSGADTGGVVDASGGLVEGEAVRLGPQGALVIRATDGTEVTVDAGDVRVLRDGAV